MSALSETYFRWQRHLDQGQDMPPHLRFDQSDASGFLRSWIAASTHDDVEAQRLNPSIITHEGFPLEVYDHVVSLGNVERLGIRTGIKQVLLPTDERNRLSVLVPIEVLGQIIELAENAHLLFPPDDLRDSKTQNQVVRAAKTYPAWLLHPEITNLHKAYPLGFGLTVINQNLEMKRTFRAAVTASRSRLVQSWNNMYGHRADTATTTERVLLPVTKLARS